MNASIAFIGAGAIGGSIAADFIDAGVSLAVYDQWPEHVETMRRDGLRVTMPDRVVEVAVDARHLCDLASHQPTFDLVFTAVDAYDTRWFAELVRPYLAADGVLVGIQNSMTLFDQAGIVGADRVLGCVVELSAQMFEPATIRRNTSRAGTWIAVGELDGTVTPRAEQVARLLAHAATTTVSANIVGAKWTKLVANCMMMGPYALFGLREQEASRLPGMIDISIALGREAAQVGGALGYTLQPIFGLTAEDFGGGGDETLRTALSKLLDDVGRDALNTMIQDQMKGRRSEYEWINGLVSRHGKELGVPTPASDAVVELSRQIDRGQLKMSVDNLERLRALVAEG